MCIVHVDIVARRRNLKKNRKDTIVSQKLFKDPRNQHGVRTNKHIDVRPKNKEENKRKRQIFKKGPRAQTKKTKIERVKSIWSMLPSTALASSSTIPSPKVRNPVWSGGRAFSLLFSLAPLALFPVSFPSSFSSLAIALYIS